MIEDGYTEGDTDAGVGFFWGTGGGGCLGFALAMDEKRRPEGEGELFLTDEEASGLGALLGLAVVEVVLERNCSVPAF